MFKILYNVRLVYKTLETLDFLFILRFPIMKITLVLIASLALVLGGVPKDRFDPCIFIDCTKFTTTKPTTKTKTPKITSLGNAPKSEELIKIKTKLVSAFFLIHFLFQEYFSVYVSRMSLMTNLSSWKTRMPIWWQRIMKSQQRLMGTQRSLKNWNLNL